MWDDPDVDADAPPPSVSTCLRCAQNIYKGILCDKTELLIMMHFTTRLDLTGMANPGYRASTNNVQFGKEAMLTIGIFLGKEEAGSAAGLDKEQHPA